MSDSEVRLIVIVPNLKVTRVWDVGHVYFHPAGAVAGLIEEARDGTPGRALLGTKNWSLPEAGNSTRGQSPKSLSPGSTRRYLW